MSSQDACIIFFSELPSQLCGKQNGVWIHDSWIEEGLYNMQLYHWDNPIPAYTTDSVYTLQFFDPCMYHQNLPAFHTRRVWEQKDNLFGKFLSCTITSTTTL